MNEENKIPDFIMITKPEQGVVAPVLKYGRENAMTGDEIRRLLGISDIRTVTKYIEMDRRRGIPICAAQTYPAGYFLPATVKEAEQYRDMLERRADSINYILDEVNAWISMNDCMESEGG